MVTRCNLKWLAGLGNLGGYFSPVRGLAISDKPQDLRVGISCPFPLLREPRAIEELLIILILS